MAHSRSVSNVWPAWLMGSLCTKFHRDRWNGKAVTVRQSLSVIQVLPYSWYYKCLLKCLADSKYVCKSGISVKIYMISIIHTFVNFNCHFVWNGPRQNRYMNNKWTERLLRLLILIVDNISVILWWHIVWRYGSEDETYCYKFWATMP